MALQNTNDAENLEELSVDLKYAVGNEYANNQGTNGRSCQYVHRLIAITFLGDHPDLVVNHKNGIRLENLEFVTQQENVRRSVRLIQEYN